MLNFIAKEGRVDMQVEVEYKGQRPNKGTSNPIAGRIAYHRENPMLQLNKYSVI